MKKYRLWMVCLINILILSVWMDTSIFAAGTQGEDYADNPAITIALDPGHGGEEDGAWYYGLKEKDANLRIAELVRDELLEYPNVTVVLTRESDEKIGLQERVIRAADLGADIFVSLHLNASVSHKSNGATVYVTTAERYRETVCDLADYLLGEFETLGLNNNGTIARVTQMGGRRTDGSFDDYYGVLRHAYNYGMPGILIEHCFMDSEVDLPFLKSEEGMQKLACADANGIAAYYGLIKEDGTKPEEKHAKVKGATTKGIELDCFTAPNVKGVRLVEYDGKTPGIADYEVDVEDKSLVTSLYLVYKNADGKSVTVPFVFEKGLASGRHRLKAFIPAFLSEGNYMLSFVGASNEALYDAGYNYADGEMVGFGKCQWLNSFVYNGEANFTVLERSSISTSHARWFEYEIEKGLRDKRERYPAIFYPN
ncbi:MAG: N-acetylmuramoyl-L-alanine amidase [Clostridiales bacterium]|nr:N-acetylmuramoyl-L-alanine amidase [Clostridiales bacterium]